MSLSVKIDQSSRERTTAEVIFLTANHCPVFVFTIMQWLQIKLLDDVRWLSTKMQQDQENTLTSCGQAVHCVYFCRTVGALHPVLRLSDVLKLLLRCSFPFNVLNLLFSILFFVIQFELVLVCSLSERQRGPDVIMSISRRFPERMDGV